MYDAIGIVFRRHDFAAIPHVVAVTLDRPAAVMANQIEHLLALQRRVDDYNGPGLYRLGGDRYMVHYKFVLVGRAKF